MKSIMLINIVSIILGVGAFLSLQGLDYPNREQILDMGPIPAQDIKKGFRLSFLLGGLREAGRSVLDLLGIRFKK